MSKYKTKNRENSNQTKKLEPNQRNWKDIENIKNQKSKLKNNVMVGGFNDCEGERKERPKNDC